MSKQRLKTCAGNLALVHRDIRITDVSSPFAYPRGEICGAFAFANSVFRRHNYNSVRYWQRLQRTFRLLRYVWNTVGHHHHLSLGVNRYFSTWLSVNRYFTGRLYTNIGSVLKRVSRTEAFPRYLTNNRVQNTNNAVRLNNRVKNLTTSLKGKTGLQVTYLERLVQRVVKRSIRIEENIFHRNAQRILSPPKTEYLKPAPPVPRQVPRSVEEMSSDPSVPGQQINDSPETSNRSMMRRHYDDAQRTTPVNVEQLTHQVVRAIDRRIIAQRERMGKI
jgi:hypothetical protein